MVNETLDGRAREISQHTIAEAVFGRGEEFDPATDPIVRIQAGRVRRSLDGYYRGEGKADPVDLQLPKGSYVPSFAERASASGHTKSSLAAETWSAILVLPFRNQSGREDIDYLADGLAYDLAAQLSRYAAWQVFLADPADSDASSRPATRFQVGGSIGLQGEDLCVRIHLVDGSEGHVIWAREFADKHKQPDNGWLHAAIEEAAATIAEENGVVVTQLLPEVRKQPVGDGLAYAAILRHHHYEATRTPHAFAEALEALNRAVGSHPTCALCWSYLARLGIIHWSLGLPGQALSIDDAVAAARRGVSLDPSSVPARLVLAYAQLVTDDVAGTRATTEEALRINGDSLFWLDTIGYFLTLAGDTELGPRLLRRAVRLNPYHRTACQCGLWLDAARRDDWTTALAAARAYRDENVFWQPLLIAVALVGVGEKDAAIREVERILSLQPDFPERGPWLIIRYVKEPRVVRRIETNLAAAGLG